MEPAELGQVFDELAAGLLLYARQLAGGGGGGIAAEDLVQEAFVKLAGQKSRPTNPRAWMLLTVKRLALDAARGARRRNRRDERAGVERWFERNAPAEGAAEFAGAEVGEVQDALAALELAEREAIVLRIWNGATFEEIAAVMGLPLSTVYLRYRTGLERLRSRWELPCRKK